MPHAEQAAWHMFQASERRSSVGIFGDFDVDGLTGTAILVRALQDHGIKTITYIPDRVKEGHGLSTKAIDILNEHGADLIVTVDTGTTAVDEVAYASDRGIRTVITDHHLAGAQLPEAAAIVNPQANGAPDDARDLSGAGVAFKIAQLLYEHSERPIPASLISLAGLGTLADVVPLRGDNRLITSIGLQQLMSTDHPGLRCLVDMACVDRVGGPLTARDVTFQITPRLNAPGRLTNADPALRLLTTSDPKEAEMLASRLDTINDERRSLGKQAWSEAMTIIDPSPLSSPVLIARIDWVHPGLLGPLAGRLCGEFMRPAIAIAVSDGVARASLRSVAEFDVHSALLPHVEDLLRFGGHSRAAGFTVREELLDKILDSLQQQARWSMAGLETIPALEVDTELEFSQISHELWDFVDQMAPFGEGNSSPVFVTRGVQPVQVRTMGSGRHLRFSARHTGQRFDALGFGFGSTNLGPDLVDIAYSLRTSYWKGKRRRELELIDITPSEKQ